MTLNSKHLPIMAFLLLGMIWGSNFIYMKLASELITPTQIVFFRVIFGFFPILLYALAKKTLRWSHLKHSVHFIVMSILATTLYYVLYAKGVTLLLSGVAGALSGSIPLFSFIFAIAFIPDEKPSLLKSLGIATGLLGVIIIARPSGDTLLSSNIQGVLCMVAGSLSVGASFVYARKFIIPLNIPAAALTTYQLGFAMITLALVTSYDGMSNIWTNYNASIGLVVGLGLLGTGLAYIIYYYLVSKLGAVTASSSTYIPPLFALLIGAVIVGEPIELLDYFATALIFMGVYMLKRK